MFGDGLLLATGALEASLPVSFTRGEVETIVSDDMNCFGICSVVDDVCEIWSGATSVGVSIEGPGGAKVRNNWLVKK